MNENNNMKQMLENLPRYDYKCIRFFKEKEEMLKAIDELHNNGFNTILSRTLTENYIKEIYDLFIFLPREGTYPMIAGIVGAIIGAIVGWEVRNSNIFLPILNSALSGSNTVITILLGGILGIILSTFIGVLILFKPINNIKPGYHMLTIYDDAEKRREIKSIFNKFDTIKL